MNKLTTVVAGISLILVAGAAGAAPSGTGGGGSGTGGSGTAGTGVDVVANLIVSLNPSVTRSNRGGLANALLRITSGGRAGDEGGNGGQGKDKDGNR